MHVSLNAKIAVSCAILLAVFVILIFLIRLVLHLRVKVCASNASLNGRTVIVTGANHGIGFETAKDLAGREAKVILACRNEERGLFARDKIITETKNNNVVYKNLDLASLASVRKFAKDVLDTEKRLDVLINNAGTYGFSNNYTNDGIIEGMQINYFGPFLLTILLLPLLKRTKSSKIINLTSILHFFGSVKFDYINKKGYYNDHSVYFNSKLCNLIFTVELSKRLKDTGVVVNAVHPGVIFTDITKSAVITTRLLFRLWCWICCRSAVDGAQTVIYLAASDEAANVTGKYFVDCKERFMSWKALNVVLADHLWEFSEKLVAQRYEE